MFLTQIGIKQYKHKCNHCSTIYIRKYKSGSYCKTCCEKKVWLVGKTRDKSIGRKISKSKKKWYKTNDGQIFKKYIGKVNSVKMLEFNKTPYGKELILHRAKKQSIIMKNKIIRGEFTPPITNTFTHWDAKIGDIRFRSSWEACFWVSNQHLLYESTECRTEKQENGRVYIGDFYDTEHKILYEIKPKSFFLKQSYKIDALITHCEKNNYKFKWINEFNILDYICEPDFDTIDKKIQLNKLYDGVKKN